MVFKRGEHEMRSPIKIRKHLVTKAPIEQETVQNNNLYKIKELTVDDIYEDAWLKKNGKVFEKMLVDGHLGIIALNQNNECIAYSFIAIGNLKPNHIPKIPKNSAWLHYARVRDDYRGKGIHRMLMYERNKFIRDKFGMIDIYTDTSENNIPSRVNQLKLNFSECGIYYTLEIGARRVPFLHLLFGIWKKDKKHPEIKKGN